MMPDKKYPGPKPLTDNVLARYARPVAVAALTLFILGAGMIFYQQGVDSETSKGWVLHTYDVTGHIQLLYNRLKDVEIGQRGFIIAGDEAYLQPYQDALKDSLGEDARSDRLEQHHSLKEELSILYRLTQDNPVQQRNLDEMANYINQLLDYWAVTIQIRQNTGADPNSPKLDFRGENQVMNHVKSLVNIMMAQENQLLAKRTQTATESAHRNHMLVFSGLAFFYIIMVIVIWLGSRLTKEKLRAQNDLVSQKALLESLIEALPIPLFAKSAADKYRYILWNARAEEMFVKPRAKVLGTTDYEHFPETRAKAIRAIDTNVMETGQSLDIPKEKIETVSGDWLSHTRKIPIYDSQNQPSMLLGIFEDITEREAMDRMKSEFVSTVSHELRTPLTSIRGSLGLVMAGIGGVLPDKARGLIEIAYKNCERLILLINDILDLEKLESGQMHFDMQWTEVKTLLQQAVELNKPYCDKYNVSLAIASEVPSIKVNVDSARFMQVMTNLISNAAKFSPSGGKVTIVTEMTEFQIRIAIKDNGVGIPREFQSRIFGKFAQADSSETKAKGGTGLGLNITKSMVERMGGDISFTSTENVGTEFFITLPVVTATALTNPLRRKTDVENRILICEDDPDIAGILKQMLELQKFTVDVAFSAGQAQGLLRNNAYNLLALDLGLPDKDGVEFIRELRAADETRKLPIIVISARAEEGKKELNGSAIGIIDWLVKPIDHDRLIAAITRVTQVGTKPWLLHVEDDKDIAHVVALGLQEVANVIQASTVEEAKSVLLLNTIDLVLLDLALPDKSGLELLGILNKKGSKPIPVIIFSASEVSPDVGHKVAAALVKAKTSEAEIVSTIIEHLRLSHS